MFSESFRSLKASVLQLNRRLWQTRALWARALLCWSIGLSFVFLDVESNFDTRFKMRGSQAAESRIVIVDIEEREWASWHGDAFNRLSPLSDFQVSSDSFFWHERTWIHLLDSILSDDPSAIGVTLYFPLMAAIPDPRLQNRKVVWAARMDSDGHVLYPAQSRPNGSNTGIVDFRSDDDRVVREFQIENTRVPHMALRLAKLAGGQQPAHRLENSQLTLNYPGRAGYFSSVSVIDVLSHQLPKGFFKDKIVIIGPKGLDTHSLLTPLGSMDRNELIATATQNVLDDKWIRPIPAWLSSGLLAIMLSLAIMVFSYYPQSVALVLLFWLGVGWSAMSLWAFDTYYIWIPILAMVSQLVFTYVVFLGYRLSTNENLSWRLKQEKKYLTEVEELKNNFVSLISHDLKTPIAKIQAICDRLMAHPPGPEDLKLSLSSLRKESSELHRYIQSILRISRVESTNFKINKEAGDINELIERAVEQIHPLAQAKQIQVNLDLEPMFLVELDHLLIFEVILNLIENAVKYTPQGGTVRVISRELDGLLEVVVEDNGPGISQNDQTRIFEKFYRGRDHNMNTSGSGLGLFLVKYFIELHGGKVLFESQVGKGTKVGFRLPLQGVELTQPLIGEERVYDQSI